MDKKSIPVERSIFIVTKIKEYNCYAMFSEKYNRSFEVGINWLAEDKLKRPDVGDLFELPDCMLYEDTGRPIFSIQELSFGLPGDNVALPKDFNIEEDYAYLTYKLSKERVLLQRYYG